MPTKAEEYRAKAADCERAANEAKDPIVKEQLQVLARTWRAMAAEAERWRM
jgi:hypothetical protein